MIKHLVASIDWCIRHLNSIKNKDKRKLRTYEVFWCSNEEFLEECEKYKKMWYTVIPNWECDNRWPDGHCLWHKN